MTLELTEQSLSVIFEDSYLLVINKPSGLLSVNGRGPEKQDSVQSRAQQLYAQALVVHRLDCATSGLMVLAKTKAAQAELNRQFRDREVCKEYRAITFGPCPQKKGSIDLPLITDWPNRPRQKICFEQGKQALTEYECLAQENGHNLLLLRPITGRSHQLRVHTMALGMAIVGDKLYASEAIAAMSARLMLHAHRIRFAHPSTGKPLALEASLPF